MNRRWLAGLLTAALLWGMCPCHGAVCEEAPVCPTIYLRVVARNDSEEAQAEKLQVRDAVLAVCPGQCAEPGALLPLIQSVAASFAPCRVDIRPRTPGGGVAPAPTVYILLGEGNGHNWWGILYQNALLWARIGEEATKCDETSEEESAELLETSETETAARDEVDGEASASSDHPEKKAPPPEKVEFVWPFLTWLRGLLRL